MVAVSARYNGSDARANELLLIRPPPPPPPRCVGPAAPGQISDDSTRLSTGIGSPSRSEVRARVTGWVMVAARACACAVLGATRRANEL